MITYEVTATVEPGLAAEYERYMRERHIPDVVTAGRFIAASFARSSEGRYRIRYEAANRQALERYLSEHAPRLRADVERHFPSGVALSREIWDVLEAWPLREG